MNKLDTNSDLYKIRHSLAHVLAQAVLEYLYQYTIKAH